MYKYAVIGKGMIGSAAARYLSQWEDGVALIGPDEPSGDWSTHDGVFASHYDQGRITRRLDGALTWALWGDRSINAYADIEKKSGIRFHYPCGGMMVCEPSDDPESSINRLKQNAWRLGTTFETYSSETYRSIRPEIAVDNGLIVLHESDGAGYINPRSLVAAQVSIAEMQGADVIRQRVTALDTNGAGVTLTTAEGETIQAERVVVAAGAWTQFLTGIDLGFVPNPRTIVMARLDQAEAERLKDMPTIIFYEGCEHPDVGGFYILPPIEYPDGHTYIKLGGSLKQIVNPQSAAELEAWFHGGGSPVEAAGLEEVLRRVIPGLQAEAIVTKTCVTTYRPQGVPMLEPIIGDRVMVAAAGCGAAAKSSNEIGRLAAIQLMDYKG
ncbi:MAG: FAD-dependent oxidoreductase [Chloroflexota bacterium]